MNKLTLGFIGPFAFTGSDRTIDQIPTGVNGVYLWCVNGDDGVHRVHYVGEAADVAKRLRDHRKHQLAGKYTGFCPDGLRRNIKVLKHRASQGMLAKYSALDRAQFNQELLEAFSIFYADVGSDADRTLRCRYELALYLAVEDHGQNILAVGHLRSHAGEKFEVAVDCGPASIEGLSCSVFRV